MAIALDGVATTSGGNSASATVTLSTKGTSDLVRVFVEPNGATVTGVTSTSGLNWQRRAATATGTGSVWDTEVWWTTATTPLTNEQITVKYSGSATYWAVTAWALSGVNVSSPFRNSAAVTGTSQLSVNCEAGDWVDGGYRMYSAQTPTGPGAPWTTIANVDWTLLIGQAVSASNASLVVPDNGQTIDNGIADAIVPSGTTPPPPPPPTETLTVSAPTGVVTGSAITLSGTVQGATLTALDYVLNGGTPTALGSFAQSGTNWTGQLPAFTTAGSYTVLVEDPATQVQSSPVTLAVTAPAPSSQTLQFNVNGGSINATGTLSADSFTGTLTVTGTVSNITLNGTAI